LGCAIEHFGDANKPQHIVRKGGTIFRGNLHSVESVEVWYARAKYDSAKPKLRLFGLP
jgi:hypothetical protein